MTFSETLEKGEQAFGSESQPQHREQKCCNQDKNVTTSYEEQVDFGWGLGASDDDNGGDYPKGNNR